NCLTVGIDGHLFGYGEWISIECEAAGIKILREQRAAAYKKKLTRRRVDCSRVRLKQTLSLRSIKLTDISATIFGRTRNKVEKVPAVREELRKAMPGLLDVEPRYRGRFPTCDRDTV